MVLDKSAFCSNTFGKTWVRQNWPTQDLSEPAVFTRHSRKGMVQCLPKPHGAGAFVLRKTIPPDSAEHIVHRIQGFTIQRGMPLHVSVMYVCPRRPKRYGLQSQNHLVRRVHLRGSTQHPEAYINLTYSLKLKQCGLSLISWMHKAEINRKSIMCICACVCINTCIVL